MISREDLPREKLKARGAAALSDIELLQAVIGSGGKNNDYRQIAKNLSIVIKKKGPDNLSIDDVKAIKGIGEAKATVIFAALEFWRRKFIKQTAPIVDSPEEAARQLNDIKDKKQEHVILLTLDGARRLVNKHTISVGTLMSSLVHPREVFSPAIEDRAASIIIAHNHPSGDPKPSDEDISITIRLKEAGDILGIPLVDHFIISKNSYYSFKLEKNIL